MTSVRPLERDDLPAVASLYAELVKRPAGRPTDGYVDFFARTLLDQPFVDPEIPSLVCETQEDGVVAVVGSHVRPFLRGGEPVRLACCGPLIVRPEYRSRGVGALLLRRYVAGPQDVTVNDRVIDEVRPMWLMLGAAMDSAASIAWQVPLRPAGYVADVLTPRRLSRRTPLGGAALSKLGPRLRRMPTGGSSEPLADADLLELIDRLGRGAVLRPSYGEPFLGWLFETMEGVDFGDKLVRRLVRDDAGRAIGAHVTYVHVHGAADVMALFGDEKHLGLILDHLFADVTAAGAVKVRGRVEPALLAPLLDRGARLGPGEWVTVHSRDPQLVGTILAGRSIVSRMDGEWWMRPRPERP